MSSDAAYAPAPFDHPKADIILRSSDNVDFRVFKLFLSLASPVFETLFDIPQPAGESDDQEINDGLAVIPLTEDSKTLDTLLRFCYPLFSRAIEKKARQAIANPKILEAEPLRCFAIARRGGLREETLLAAKYTLTQPLIPSWFQEIELISATDLLSLLTYHRKCGEAVYALRLDRSWITSHYGSAEACNWLSGQGTETYTTGRYAKRNEESDCRCKDASTSNYKVFNYRPLQWWEDFMEGTFTELRDKPCKATVHAFAKETVQAVKAKKCSVCSPGVTEGMRDFVALFERKIEEIVSTIELKLNV